MPAKRGWPALDPTLRSKLGETTVNDPAAATLSEKPAISEATASPEVTAMSASIWVSSICEGPDRSVLQPAAPSARSIAAALSIEFLRYIKNALLGVIAAIMRRLL